MVEEINKHIVNDDSSDAQRQIRIVEKPVWTTFQNKYIQLDTEININVYAWISV